MKYAVAVLSFFDNENSIKVVDAESPLEAVFAAVEQSPENYQNVESVEDLLIELFNQDMAVSAPLSLELALEVF